MQRIVEIAALPNAAHRNQSFHGFVPEGWAAIPEDMETENFPFGEVEVAEVDGVMTVTKWTPGELPRPEIVTPTPTQRREEAYNTQPIVEWDGEKLTVTQAAQKWQYYAAEGSTKADELQVLIATAKQTIREQHPDEEVETK